ncbi:MAG TPA: deoxyribodipyrimidine photo-lyase [Alphaproteobacteria bacterium]|nr:deoxyribodipyrimidine photo-lyase [Alphaproteobacteria bacterium]
MPHIIPPEAKSAAPPAVVWFRNDLRLTDNPALRAAAASRRRLVPIFILDDAAGGKWGPGGASRWWLHHSLTALGDDLAARGAPLVLRRGCAADVLAALIGETGASAVFWNRRYEPHASARDAAIEARLVSRGVTVETFDAALLHEPGTIADRSGAPHRVFTQFWRACRTVAEPPRPHPAPLRLTGLATAPGGERLADWRLLPTAPDWAGGLRRIWRPGEAGAMARLDAFLSSAITGYDRTRDRPGRDATSRLSPHLHWGEIGPRQIWHAVRASAGDGGGAERFLTELGWREFSHHLLHHAPDMPEQPLRREFARFPWRRADAHLRAWRRGHTGYPIVDAGMRELWTTGWMHNRARMIAASFLVKDLLVPWQDGAAWFWDTLVDADLANNSANWQWIAGCGADAAPYFRIFNPVLQGEKFDPDGDYVRRFVPELARLPAAWIHKPWQAPGSVLDAADVRLGQTYPRPIVDHGAARVRALAAFAAIKRYAS